MIAACFTLIRDTYTVTLVLNLSLPAVKLFFPPRMTCVQLQFIHFSPISPSQHMLSLRAAREAFPPAVTGKWLVLMLDHRLRR